jgi:hypothetical protein
MEFLIAFDLQALSGQDLFRVVTACVSFASLLEQFKLRPTSLHPMVYALDISSRSMTLGKFHGLYMVSLIACQQCSHAEASELFQITHDLAKKADYKIVLVRAILAVAETQTLLGQCRAVQKLMNRAREAEGRNYEKAHAAFVIGYPKQRPNPEITGTSLPSFFQKSHQSFEAEDIPRTQIWLL